MKNFTKKIVLSSFFILISTSASAESKLEYYTSVTHDLCAEHGRIIHIKMKNSDDSNLVMIKYKDGFIYMSNSLGKPNANTDEIKNKETQNQQKVLDREKIKDEIFHNSQNEDTQLEWYEKGDLHEKIIAQWRRADYDNKLATCAGILAIYWRNNKTTIPINMDNIKDYAKILVQDVDTTIQKVPGLDGRSVSEMVVAAAIAKGWIR